MLDERASALGIPANHLPQVRQMNAMNRAKLESLAKSLRRRRRGNVMVLAGAITLGIIIAVILFALDYNQFMGASHQHLTAVEAAGLAAAQDLSRIVVKDPNYGYIALTDYPPIGAATTANEGAVPTDGRPLPVTGINTIMGTARLDSIIASEIGNADLQALAKKDAQNAAAAAKLLQDCLETALADTSTPDTSTKKTIAGTGGTDPRSGPFTDMDGNVISPYQDARTAYMANLSTMANGGKPVVNSFNLQLGFLANGGTTLTAVPQPVTKSQTDNATRQGDFYKAFVEVPVTGATTKFYFAGLSAQPALIDARQFRRRVATDPVVCSAVRVEAEHTVERVEQTTQAVVKTIACAEPAGTSDTYPPGVYSLGFPDGLVPGIGTIKDLFDSPMMTGTGDVVTATGADWPYDPNSTLVDGKITVGGGTGETGSPTVSQMFIDGFHGWLRTGRTRPRVDSVVAMMDYNLNNAFAGATGVNSKIEGGASTSSSSSTTYLSPDQQKLPPFDFMQAAYAGGDTSSFADGVYTAILDVADVGDRLATLKSKSTAGVQAYNMIANYSPLTAGVPENAAKVVIDDSGNLKSTSGESLSNADLQALWEAIQETNSAAFQTKAVAQVALGEATSGLLPLGPIQNAIANADAAIARASDLLKNQSSYTEDGIKKNGDGTFTLGGEKFTPHPTAAANIAAILGNNAPSGEPSNKSWTANPDDFKIFDADKAGTNSASSGKNPWHMLMLQFDSSGYVNATSLDTTPFMNLPISSGQIMAVSYDAVTSVGNVQWTAVSRNNCEHWGVGKHGGQPLAGTPVNWCEVNSFGGSSTLAQVFGRGQQTLGIEIVDFGGGPSAGPKGSKGSKGSKGGRGQQGLQGGSGPRGGAPGTGKYDNDVVGFPWGFKAGPSSTGEKWKPQDVKYQFPEGLKELSGKINGSKGTMTGSGKALGKVASALNKHEQPDLPTPSPSGAPSGLPFGEQAKFKPLGGTLFAVQPRANYYCGGFAADFQLRSPIKVLNIVATTKNGLKLSAPGTGKATVNGKLVSVDGLLGIDITTGSQTEGVIDNGDTQFTNYIPKAPLNLN